MISIVTDSAAYLTRAEAAELGARVASMTFSTGGGVSMPEGFMGESPDCGALTALGMERMRTSQATYADFLELFSELVARGDEVLCLTMSSRLSGTHGNALLAAKEVSPEHIAVVDTRATCGGEYLLVRCARRLIDKGLSLCAIADQIEKMREGVHITFTVDDIGPLRRSGRLGGVRLSISTILNIRPVLGCLDGSIVAVGTARGRGEQFRALMADLPEEPCECVVEEFGALERAQALAERIRAAGHTVLVRRIGPVLGIHLGAGCMGVSRLSK